MPLITLPDGQQRRYDKPVTVARVAEDIGAGLFRVAVAAEVDGRPSDLGATLQEDTQLRILTPRDPEGLEIVRHSTAHLMAHAVKRLFRDVQIAIGPVIEDGFYYDFHLDHPLHEDDLRRIEDEMRRISKENIPVQREEWSRRDAIALFANMGEHYKVRIIEELPEDEKISLYRQGDFVDLCRGVHVPGTGKIKAFKLTRLAGAYWRGNADNEQLQRIYGTAWPDRQSLDDYLERIAQAERRDHRKLGKMLDLFHMQEEAPGMVFWHDHGWQLYTIIQDYIRGLLRGNGYQEVNTPQLVDRVLWERSGHWEWFGDNMFITGSEQRDYAIKPMNCPCHIQIFNRRLNSYRDLPVRMAEFGSCHRNEPSGALHGLMRVRHFVQDDAHIFCTEDQLTTEVGSFIDMLRVVYHDFGFDEIRVKLATRPEHSVGETALWEKAETALRAALEDKSVDWELNVGEGAFYGPKIEFSLKDCLGRVWQCGTVQIDFNMPGRLGAEYVSADGDRRVPVLVHRAILGSLERFIGILIEHYAGAFPLWLAPVQLVILDITDAQADYATVVWQRLRQAGFRVEKDLRNEKIGYKIREHAMRKIPYLLIAGEREVKQNTIAVRSRDGSDLGIWSLEQLTGGLEQELSTRGGSPLMGRDSDFGR